MSYQPQRELLDQLVERFRSRTLPASLLLAGPKGIGKWSLAFDLAKRITCTLATAAEACGKCDSCRQFDQFAHPDVQFLFPLPAAEKDWDEWYAPYLFGRQENPFGPTHADTRQFIPIDAIRRFQSRLATRSVLSPNRIGVIYEAERMLPGTMDSLLKLLEEPPEKCFLLVVTDQPRLLLPTILSRLQRVNVRRLSDSQVAERVRSTHGIDAGRAELIARLARGSLYSVDSIVEGEFFRLRDSAWEMLAAGLTQKSPAIYARFAESAAISSRERVEILGSHWQNMIRDLALLRAQGAAAPASAPLQLIYFDFLAQYQSLSNLPVPVTDWGTLSDRLERLRLELRRNVNARMAALNFLMGLAGESRAA